MLLSYPLQPICDYSAHAVLMVRTNGVRPPHQWCGALNTLQQLVKMGATY